LEFNRQLLHLGAEKCVTGSCHLLQVRGLNIMVDCGLAQGGDSAVAIDAWPLPPTKIDYLFLTHAHIDHTGRVPDLIRKGFGGEIICSHPTKALLSPMLADAMRFSGMPAKTAGPTAKAIDDLSWGFEYGERFDLENGVAFMLRRAGHILGSCFVRIEDERNGWSVLFSGDLGATDTPLLHDVEPPDTADLVVMESTYGDRLHGSRKQRVAQLGRILTRALTDKGKVFIPAFSLGRTQELIYEMDRIFSDSRYGARFPELQGRQRPPVFIDSPLGLEITQIYARLSEYWDQEAKALQYRGDHPIDFDVLYAVESHRDHQALCEAKGPAVILAGSGMCTGGRIIDHLRQGIERPANDILFVGYQAAGTPGRAIQDFARKRGGYVLLDGTRKSINARVHTLSGYSAHADQQGLIAWLESMPEKPGAVKLVHGQRSARTALSEELMQREFNIIQ
jgi:metallo-beta-lactamase family protein